MSDQNGPRTDDETSAQRTTLNRRSVLSKAAIGATGFIGVAGTAGAADGTEVHEKRKMIERFSDDADVIKAFEDAGEKLVSALSADGLLSEADTSTLSNAVEQSGSIVGVVEERGQLVTHLQTEFDVPDGTVTAVVHVETGRSYAFYEPHAGDEMVFVDADVQESVGTESCYNVDTKCDLPEDCEDDEDDYDFRLETSYDKICCANNCEWKANGDCCTGG